MKKILKMLDFHLFEGGDGGGAGAGTSGGASGAAEGTGSGLSDNARSFMKELGITDDDITSGMNETTEAEPTIVYGKEEQSEGGAGGSQVGTDTQTATGTSVDDPEAEFAELIGKGGRFHDIYGQSVANAVNQRFKNAENLQGKVTAYDNALAPLYAKYGLNVGDVEGLTRAIEGDNDIYASRAEAEGMTPEKYRQQLKLEMEAAQGRSMMQEIQRQQQMQATFARWNNEAEALKEVFPNFDIQSEIQNPVFQDTLNRVGNVRDAFMITHMNEILSGQTDFTAQQTQQQMVQTMKAKAARPTENGVRQSPAIVRKSDPSQFNDEDMDKIFAEVESGKKFSF